MSHRALRPARRMVWPAVWILIGCMPRRPANEIRHHGDDLVASGQTPEVTDSTLGDAMLCGGDLRFAGATGSDYLGVAGHERIGGRIHGSMRAAGGEVLVTATVDRNATIAGGNVELDSGASVGRNAYLAAGMVRVEGEVRGALTVAGGTVVLDGPVGGDVEAYAGNLLVGPHARIAGNLRYRVRPGKVQIDPAAHIGSITVAPFSERTNHHRGFVFALLWVLGFLVAGTVTVTIVPRVIVDATSALQQTPAHSVLIGVLWLLVVPFAVIAMAITILGLPLALLLVLVYVLLLYLGHITLSVWLGRRILRTPKQSGMAGVGQQFLIGGVVMVLVRLIPIVGPLATFVASLFGIGAILLELRNLREASLSTPAP